MKRLLIAVAVLGLLACTFSASAQVAPTTSTRILAANGPAFVTFYYQPGTSLIWEAKLVCNEYTGQLTLQFIQPAANEPDTNTSFYNACTVTGAGTKDVTVTTTAPLTFTDTDGEQQTITSLGWEATCQSTRTGCKWTSSSNNGMSLNYDSAAVLYRCGKDRHPCNLSASKCYHSPDCVAEHKPGTCWWDGKGASWKNIQCAKGYWVVEAVMTMDEVHKHIDGR